MDLSYLTSGLAD